MRVTEETKQQLTSRNQSQLTSRNQSLSESIWEPTDPKEGEILRSLVLISCQTLAASPTQAPPPDPHLQP